MGTIKRIYTRTGDKGLTSIRGGGRVPKDDIRIEANGCLDELNAVIGIVRSLLPEAHEWQSLLFVIQKDLMGIMSHVATPSAARPTHPNALPEDMVSLCEETMDKLVTQMPDSGCGVLPGGTPLSAQLQFARTVARRAERRLWTLNRQDEVPEIILRFINRLSDLLFIMARYDMQQHGTEEIWRPFGRRRDNRSERQDEGPANATSLDP